MQQINKEEDTFIFLEGYFIQVVLNLNQMLFYG